MPARELVRSYSGVQMAKAASDAEVVFPNSTPEPPV